GGGGGRGGLVAGRGDGGCGSGEGTAMLRSCRPAVVLGERQLLRRLPAAALSEAGLERRPAYEAWRPAGAPPTADDGGWPVGGERTPALIIHTSGTTRTPKGVTHSQASMACNIGVQVAAQ